MLSLAKVKGLHAVIFLAALLCLASVAMADNITITGEVNDNYQLVADGQVYEIADTPQGNALAENHISAKVKVVGTLEEREDLKIITVLSFEVLAE